MQVKGFRSGAVAILGRPNVGKSTLVNRLVGRKVAIVTPKPQTTRARVRGILHRPHSQIVLVDTPGIHRPEHGLDRRMVDAAFTELGQSDANLVVIDGAAGLGPGDRFVVDRGRTAQGPLILCLNKIDRMPKPRLLPLIDECQKLASFAHIVPVSALDGENVDDLAAAIESVLPEGPPLYDPETVAVEPEQAAVAELIREQVIDAVEEEVPFATAVTVESWEEKEPGTPITVIGASVWVERESQKGILIGKGGRAIRGIGQRSRASIEKLLGRHVFLALEVKVHPHWRDDRAFLQRLFPE